MFISTRKSFEFIHFCFTYLCVIDDLFVDIVYVFTEEDDGYRVSEYLIFLFPEDFF